jgi:hypothetical protein
VLIGAETPGELESAISADIHALQTGPACRIQGAAAPAHSSAQRRISVAAGTGSPFH